MSSRHRLLFNNSASSSGGKLQDLVVYRQFLREQDGTPITLIGASDFNLLNLFSQGINIDSILEDREGANFLRVWTSYDIPNIGTMIYCPYESIPAFLSKCAQFGKRVELTAYTGINNPNHWPDLIAACLQSETKPLLDYVNELDQNLNEPDYLGRVMLVDNHGPYIIAYGQEYRHQRAPEPLLCSHGSNGSGHWPVEPYWDFVTFHTNGQSEWWRKNGHNAMEIWGGPSLTDEATRCSDNDSDPNRYYDAAAGGSLLCAGTLFHSVDGKTSSLFNDVEKICFNNHVEGAKSVNLICQEGDYTHKEEQIKEENWLTIKDQDGNDIPNPDYDPSKPSYLRVYKRGPEQVKIRFNE